MNATDAFALSSDLISELLTGMRLRGVQYRRIQVGAPVGLGFRARPGHAYFHYLAVGNAVLRSADGALHPLSAGNAVLIPQGDAHHLLSDPRAPVRDIDEVAAAPLGEQVSGVDTCPSTHDTPSAVLFYGCMAFDLGGMRGLGPLMPGLMLVDAASERYPGALALLDAMKREICAGRIGFAGILARLAEVVAAMIVRGWRAPSWPCIASPAAIGPWKNWRRNAMSRDRSSRNASRPPSARRRCATPPNCACAWPANGYPTSACRSTPWPSASAIPPKPPSAAPINASPVNHRAPGAAAQP